MSKIEELIRQKCPDGVVYKTLGELGEFMGGLTGKSKDDFSDGNAVFITYKNVYLNPALDIEPLDRVKIAEDENQRTLEYGDVVFTGSSETPDECGISSVVTKHPIKKLYLNSFCFVFRFNDLSVIEPNFAKHLFRSHDLRCQIGKTAAGVTRFNVSKDKMKKVIIPVPPIGVQQEIVRILDKFTELETELQAELDVRKKQYEHYRRRLLCDTQNNPTTKILPLSDIATLFRGKYITKKDSNEGSIPVILGGQEPAYYIDRFNHEGEIVAIARSGVSAGFVSYWNEPIYITDGFGYEAKEGVSIPKYLYYVLKNIETDLNMMKRGAGVPHVSGEALSRVELAIPSLEEQQNIVAILDKFDEICNNQQKGLPAEIEACHKQYEYYRDKLLTFKRKVV